MSKYKVGDKFVVEIQNLYNREFPPSTTQLYQLDGFCNALVDEDDLDKLQKLNPQLKIEDIDDMLAEYDFKKASYEKGLNDAWELARKISHMCLDDMNKCFDLEDLDKYGADMMLYEHYTPQQALAKIEAYEKSHIEIGDVVDINGNIAVVTSFGTFDIKNDSIYVLLFDGVTNCFRKDDKSIKKTGRHIDIEHLLEQIRGNE